MEDLEVCFLSVFSPFFDRKLPLLLPPALSLPSLSSLSPLPLSSLSPLSPFSLSLPFSQVQKEQRECTRGISETNERDMEKCQ